MGVSHSVKLPIELSNRNAWTAIGMSTKDYARLRRRLNADTISVLPTTVNVGIHALLCATSVCSLSLWLFLLSNNEPQRHRAHRGCTEKKPNRDFRAKPL